MKVAVSFPNCHRRGGIERVVLETANYLAGRGHEVHLCACQWDEQALNPRVRRHAITPGRGPAPLPAIAFARRSRPVVAEVNADVCAAFGVYCPPEAVLWAGSVHRAWLQTSQGQRGWWGRLKQRLNPFHPVMLGFERYYLRGRRYRKLIAHTEQVKTDMIRYYGVPENDIAIIPCGFSPSEFNLIRRRELRQKVRQRLGIAENEKIILFVANELDRKGFGPLIRAMAKVCKPSERLVAVGRFSPAGYRAEIEALGLTDRVTFAGSANDVAEFYAAADVFTLPTQYEPWGLVIVEALATGVPVLTSRLAGAAVAVHEGTSGLLLDHPRDDVEVAAKLRRLLDGEHGGEEAIAHSVADLSWPMVLERYEQILQECAGA